MGGARFSSSWTSTSCATARCIAWARSSVAPTCRTRMGSRRNHRACSRFSMASATPRRRTTSGWSAERWCATPSTLTAPMTAPRADGIVDLRTEHSVDETVDRLQEILRSRAIELFALVDHSGEAAKAGLRMPPTKLLIFGNPKAGTPVMLAAPRAAVDLPLKILVWEDPEGQTWISYNSPDYLQRRHGFQHELVQNLVAVEALAKAAAE